MKVNNVIDKLMSTGRIKSLGLKREAIVDILKSYESIAVDHLLENGLIELGNGITIEVVPLVNRVHVLRGVAYKSSRKYKLKINIDDSIYERIESYYDKLREDIL